jgi:hypothetical protein
MELTRRTFIAGGAGVIAFMLPSGARAEGNVAAVGAAADAVVIARAGATVLAARETHLVLKPVPAPRRSAPKGRAKGAPATPQRQLVLRDVVARKGTPNYDVFLVLEGPNIFEATQIRVQVGTLELSGGSEGAKGTTIVFEVNGAMAQFSKTRGFNIRHLRVVIVRRAATDAAGKTAAPADPHPLEIGAIELVQS